MPRARDLLVDPGVQVHVVLGDALGEPQRDLVVGGVNLVRAVDDVAGGKEGGRENY